MCRSIYSREYNNNAVVSAVFLMLCVLFPCVCVCVCSCVCFSFFLSVCLCVCLRSLVVFFATLSVAVLWALPEIKTD